MFFIESIFDKLTRSVRVWEKMLCLKFARLTSSARAFEHIALISDHSYSAL